MSGITGKNALSIRKKDVVESRTLVQGFSKLRFAHQASLGDMGIALGSLVAPSAMVSLGFSNPSPSRLLDASLFRFKENLTLISSLRGELIQNLSYRINSASQITFQGFTAEEGEIFVGIVDSSPTNGIQVLDAKPQTAVGDLLDGQTDFNLGFSTRTKREEILVIRNGLAQKRNSNNSDTLTDGNYYVVDLGSGFGSVVRFNTPASGGDDSIIVMTLGNIVESPTDSTFEEIQKVQGQIDGMIPTLAALAGVPETDFQAVPNDVDLKAFGDTVLQLESLTNTLENLVNSQQLESGEYTPVITLISNTTSATITSAIYMRVGNVVTVAGRVEIDPVGAGGGEFRVSLPITPITSLGTTGIGGVGELGATGSSIRILSGSATEALMTFSAANGDPRVCSFTFTYRIQ